MNTQRWNLLEQIFAEVSDLPLAEREAFLDRACGGDAELRREAAALADATSPATELFALLGQHLTVSAPAPASVLRAGPYLLEKPIGSGGMGDVFAACRSDDQYAKRVAVKMVRMGLTAEHLVRRFRRERQILAALEHPNIARLLDGGVLENGCPYMVMELVEGETIDKWVKRNRFSGDSVLPSLLPVLRAVEYAHANLVVHCDLKPSNILVTADGVPKLLDFGVARLLQGDDDSPTTSVALTPRYAAPELRLGQPAAVSGDVYSLGVLMGELCGEALDRESDLALIIEKASATDVASRYGTVEALRLDVERLLAGHPVVARRPTAMYRFRKYVARHRVAVSLAAVAALGLVATAGVAVWQARRAEQQKVRAERVSAFLTSILGVSPDGTLNSLRGKGASLRVVDLIVEAEKRFDREFANDPEAEASLRYVIGSAYLQVGEFEKAKRNASLAIARAAPHLPPNDEMLLRLRGLQAMAHIGLGEWAESEKELSDVYTLWRNRTAPQGADILSVLGIAQFRLGKLDEAERSFQGCLDAVGSKALSGEWLSLVRSNFALVHIERGKFENAERLLRLALDERGDSNVEAEGWALTNLASVYRMMGAAEKAEPVAASALGKFEAAFGTDSPRLVNPAFLLAWAMAERGRAVDAERLLRRTMQFQKALPPEHFERSLAAHFLGLVLLRQGRLAEARKESEFALAVRRKVFRGPNWRIAETAGLLGEILVRLGENEAGGRLLAESAADFESVFGPGNFRAREAKERLRRWNLKSN